MFISEKHRSARSDRQCNTHCYCPSPDANIEASRGSLAVQYLSFIRHVTALAQPL